MSPGSPFAALLDRLHGPADRLTPRDGAFMRSLLHVLTLEHQSRQPAADEWPLAPRDPLRVQAILRALVISENTLRDRLDRLCSMRPSMLVTQVTLAIAADLLLHYPDYPVKQVCRRVGLQDDSHFARLFRRHYGVSPREYRMMSSQRFAVSSS